MKLHANASLTPKQRQQIKNLYATGHHTHANLAVRFGVHRHTIRKWANRASVTVAGSHHGKIRIARELKNDHPHSNPSSVYAVLKTLRLNQPKFPASKSQQANPSKQSIVHIPVGKHRTQMDIQVLPAIKGKQGFEYKISIIHLSTRMKYSEIHDNYESKTIASVYERALDNLPPFL